MAEDRSGRFWQCQQFLQRQPASGKGKVTACDVVRIHRCTRTAQRLDVSLQAVVTQRHLFRPGDAANALMPQFLQIIHRVEGGGEVINMYRWQLQLGGKFVGHHHWRQVALLFNAGIEWQA
jgi:hypothetical protein